MSGTGEAKIEAKVVGATEELVIKAVVAEAGDVS